VPDYKFDSWIGVLAPAGMPKAELDRLNAAINKALSDPAVQERLTRLGVETGTQSVDEFQKLLRADWDSAGAIVKAAGARIE
jgi:tripartite-type tricarboxylate transporter receptor subunit TctC